MKKWLRKTLIKFLNNNDENMIGVERPSMLSKDSDLTSQPALYFKVFDAVGGKVVEFRRYDSRYDRSDSTTYIITNDQDFGERIAKIATLENLKT